MEEIRILFRNLTGDLPTALLLVILSFVNPIEAFLTPLVKDVVTNMRDLTELFCLEHDKLTKLLNNLKIYYIIKNELILEGRSETR